MRHSRPFMTNVRSAGQTAGDCFFLNNVRSIFEWYPQLYIYRCICMYDYIYIHVYIYSSSYYYYHYYHYYYYYI